MATATRRQLEPRNASEPSRPHRYHDGQVDQENTIMDDTFLHAFILPERMRGHGSLVARILPDAATISAQVG